MYIPDNYDAFVQHDAEQARRLKRFPICECCENPIQQESALKIDGKWYCDGCIDDMKEDIDEW